ncbi:hypothetical protein PGTUg99_016814 [Puccinia graminis f. sp. tritici]|uniref:DUF5009 domain-containing protein n=1 Tax=Puccinia graminis f. sp. tritici TaxID=56615 RepID=A0A5B0QKB1_PUCGR|nr:hypothetical protein PGTUg99_016814 [Puccinia graminis f. sp. tritici]
MAHKTKKTDKDIDPVKVAESDILAKRDRSIDVLRGLTCLAMVLVNTAGPVRPSWLSHPTSIHQSITFADVSRLLVVTSLFQKKKPLCGSNEKKVPMFTKSGNITD